MLFFPPFVFSYVPLFDLFSIEPVYLKLINSICIATLLMAAVSSDCTLFISFTFECRFLACLVIR